MIKGERSLLINRFLDKESPLIGRTYDAMRNCLVSAAKKNLL